MKILIIDDCSVSRNILSKQMRLFGDADTASSGAEGVLKYERSLKSDSPYSLICLDLSMPEMDGCQTLKQIRRIEQEHNITEDKKAKVLIITAFTDNENLLKTYRDCQGYIIKPIRKAKLIEKISSFGFSLLEKASQNVQKSDISETVSGFDYSDMIPLVRRKNGKIEFLIRTKPHSDNEKDLQVVEPGELEFFKNVMAGQMLAKLETPDVGLKCGEGVFFNPQKGLLSAKKSGMTVFSGDCISINDTIIINGDLKFENIDFLGKIEINGDIKDGVKINAVKGLSVSGVVGACEIRSEGDIHLNRVNGKSKCIIKCGGNLFTRFLYDVTVECRNNIKIEVEAVGAVIKSGGSVFAGTITGGECIAFEYIEAKRAGSPKDVSTLLKTGSNYYQIDRRKMLEKNIKDIDARSSHIDSMLGPYSEDIGKSLTLTDKKQKKVYDLFSERNHLQASREGFVRELEKINALPEKKSDTKVIIDEILYKGVRLEVNDSQELVSENIKGPITIDKKLIQL